MKPQLIFDFYNTLYNPQVERPFEGAAKLLWLLKRNYQLVLVTTINPQRSRQLSRSGLKHYFSKVILCSRKSTRLFQKLSDSQPTIIIGDNDNEELTIAATLKIPRLKVNPQLENPIQTITKKLLPS